MKSNYQWHGESVKTLFGYSYVKENVDKPLCWYNYECDLIHPKGHAVIGAIKITTKDNEEFVIANHFGIGINKLLKGGWPNATHFSLPLESFRKDKHFIIKEFDLDGYSEYEANREKWQEINYPEEYKKLKELMSLKLKY